MSYKLKKIISELKGLKVVKKHIDKEYYLDKYSDVRIAGVDPAKHYLRHGWREGRDPSPEFQTNFYLETYPDVASKDICPYVHYYLFGRKEGRYGNQFDHFKNEQDKLALNEIKTILSLIDTIKPKAEKIDIEIFDNLVLQMFSPEFYRHKKGLSDDLSYTELLREYLLYDFPDGVSPSPVFDPKYYTLRADAMGLPPVSNERSAFRHWLNYGIKNQIVPTPLFSDEEYVSLNTDLKNYPDWPFIHFLRHGAHEGRSFNKLLTLSNDTIGAVKHKKSSRILELFEYVGKTEYPQKVNTEMDDMGQFLSSDLLNDIITQSTEVEPDIGGIRDYQLSLLPPWHDRAYCEYKTVRNMLPSNEYENIILVPFCKLGGADYVAGILSHALVSLGTGKTLVLRTEKPDWARPEWFADEIDSLDISRELHIISENTAIRVLYELVRETGAKNVFNVNSLRGFNLFERFGKRLSIFTNLYAYYFCADRNEDNVETGYPVWFFANIIDSLTSAIIDNQALADTLCSRYSLPPDIASKVNTIYTPAMTKIPQEAVVIRQVETSKKRNKPVIIWAGRIDRQKRFDLVVEIAKLMPHIQFRCWGKAVLDKSNEFNELPANITMEGIFDNLEELPLRNSDGWLYTSSWDGLPTILIECGGMGVPIVASSVGGIPNLITEETGWPVEENAAASVYVDAIQKMLNSPDERIKRAKSLQKLVKQRHSFDSYKQIIKTIITEH